MPQIKQFYHNLNTRPICRAQHASGARARVPRPSPLDCSLVVVNKRPVVRMLDGPEITDGRKHPPTKCLAHKTFQHMSNTKHYSVRWRWACPGDLEDYDQDKWPALPAWAALIPKKIAPAYPRHIGTICRPTSKYLSRTLRKRLP